MKKRLWLTALSALQLFLVMASPVFAEQQGNAAAGESLEKTYAANLPNTSLIGYSASQHYFRVESYWNVETVDLHLDYKATPLARHEWSSVTLLINGNPFHSFRPFVNDAKKERLTVSVPVEYVTEGMNLLTLQGGIQSTEPDSRLTCLATDTKSSWLQLFDSSRLAIKYYTDPIKGSIADFAARFNGLDTVNDGRNAVAVSSESGPAELEAAVYALSGFAGANPLKEKTIPLLELGTADLQEKRNIVVVALYDHLPQEIKALISRNSLQGKALLKVVRLGGGTAALVVTSEEPELLIRAGRLAANQLLLKQLDGSSRLVDETTEVETPAVQISNNIKLTETGDQITGPRHREKIYFISMPGNRSIADASKLSLNFRYAQNLDFERSLVTVLINDTPISSKKLTLERADRDQMTLLVPKNLNISGNFSVKVAFDLELANTGCVESQEQMPWAYVDKDSMLQLHTRDRTDLLLNNYPYPFVRDGSYNQAAVVLPRERDAYLYRSLGNIFNLLGQFTQTNTGKISFYSDDVSAKELEGKQIIAIGSFENNRIIRDNNELLYFKFNSDTKGFRSNEKMSIDSEYGKRAGSLQLLYSPYDGRNGMMVVTGFNSEYYYLASRLVATEGLLWKIYGDGVLADKDGVVHPFRFIKASDPEAPSLISNIMERSDVLSFAVIAGLVLLLVLVSLILMLRKYKKKRGSVK